MKVPLVLDRVRLNLERAMEVRNRSFFRGSGQVPDGNVLLVENRTTDIHVQSERVRCSWLTKKGDLRDLVRGLVIRILNSARLPIVHIVRLFLASSGFALCVVLQ